MSKKAGPGAKKVKAKKYPCAWKGCSGDPHPVKPKYPDKKYGCNAKKPIKDDTSPYSYSFQWPAEKHPYRTLNYPRGKKPPKVKTNFNYRIQRHHVIPGNMLKKFPDLFFNAKLKGWDHNSYPVNGLNLPTYDKDVVWNDIQAHRGCHTAYDTEVEKYMSSLEGECRAFCKNEEAENNEPFTDDILGLLYAYVEEFREEIINWNPSYYLIATAGVNRGAIFLGYSDKKSIPKYPKRKISI